MSAALILTACVSLLAVSRALPAPHVRVQPAPLLAALPGGEAVSDLQLMMPMLVLAASGSDEEEPAALTPASVAPATGDRDGDGEGDNASSSEEEAAAETLQRLLRLVGASAVPAAPPTTPPPPPPQRPCPVCLLLNALRALKLKALLESELRKVRSSSAPAGGAQWDAWGREVVRPPAQQAGPPVQLAGPPRASDGKPCAFCLLDLNRARRSVHDGDDMARGDLGERYNKGPAPAD